MSPLGVPLHDTAQRAAGGLPRAFWWLWASTLVNRLGTFVVPFLTLYLTTARGRTLAFAGMVTAVIGLGAMAGSVLGGLAADHCGARRTLVTAHLATATATAGLGLSTQDRTLWLFAPLIGLCAGAARPAITTLMIGQLEARDRVRAFSLNYWAMNLGFACAVLFAGLAARVGYPVLFLADAAATLLCAAIVLAFVPGPPPHARPATGTRERPGGLLGDRPFLVFVLLSTAVNAILQQMTVTLPVAMAHSGLTPTSCGAVIALNGVLICLFQLPAGRRLGRTRPLPLLALAAALSGIGFGCTAFSSTPLTYALTVTLWTSGEIISGPVGADVTARFAVTGAHGRYQGANAFSWAVGGVLAAAAGGYTHDHYGSDTLWTGCALTGLCTGAGFLLLERFTQPPTTDTHEPHEPHPTNPNPTTN